MKKSNPSSIDISAKEALELLESYKRHSAEKYSPEQMDANIFSRILQNIPGTVMVIDLHTNNYIYVNTPEVIGYESREFIEGGLPRVLLVFPAAHGYIMTQQIFPVMFKYFDEYCRNKSYKGLKVTYPTQLIHRDGTTRWYQHTISVLTTDEEDKPHLLLKSIYDIQDHKKDTSIDFCISYVNSKNETEILVEERFLPEITNTVLSEREGQVLSLISLGLTSAQIAEKLCISQHTVNTHRKNILRKTFCKGTADLAIFALTNGGD
jgi:DNA-binding CsgD family transcriptional regulator